MKNWNKLWLSLWKNLINETIYGIFDQYISKYQLFQNFESIVGRVYQVDLPIGGNWFIFAMHLSSTRNMFPNVQ